MKYYMGRSIGIRERNSQVAIHCNSQALSMTEVYYYYTSSLDYYHFWLRDHSSN